QPQIRIALCHPGEIWNNSSQNHLLGCHGPEVCPEGFPPETAQVICFQATSGRSMPGKSEPHVLAHGKSGIPLRITRSSPGPKVNP
ncbi:MAG: hypothetical protein AAF587_44430, partial [Bacteroidota bacterium]